MTDAAEGLTRRLVGQAIAIRFETLPGAIRTVAGQCILDWLVVTFAARDEALVRLLRDDATDAGGLPQAMLFGTSARVPAAAAARVNGSAGHALDYDDVNYALMGHPSVPLLPALFALAEAKGRDGAALMAAFVAGYEFECRVGRLVAPGHYATGFHATATLGALGAAVSCAHLLGLSDEDTAHAVGVAATQAAGLKSMFGTDCKPLHAGHAAETGLRAASLVARGFRARTDSLECAQGFAATHGPDFHPEAALEAPDSGFHLLSNLFKYHASCYETHATIECCRQLRSRLGGDSSEIAAVTVRVNPYCDRICNLPAPRTGLEAKFSLRQTAAFALAGFDTGALATFEDARVQDAGVVDLRGRIAVELAPVIPASCAEVRVRTRDGRELLEEADVGKPLRDHARQRQQLLAKAHALLDERVGPAEVDALAAEVDTLAQTDGWERLHARLARWASA